MPNFTVRLGYSSFYAKDFNVAAADPEQAIAEAFEQAGDMDDFDACDYVGDTYVDGLEADGKEVPFDRKWSEAGELMTRAELAGPNLLAFLQDMLKRPALVKALASARLRKRLEALIAEASEPQAEDA